MSVHNEHAEHLVARLAGRRPRDVDPITGALQVVHELVGADDSGEVADYIPALAGADPRWFGLALVSVDGNRYRAGDAEQRFTIQSISKPFTYALALLDRGLANVHDHVGAEPSGEAFNAISLEADTGRPANPMINAGAIVTASLLAGADADERFARARDLLGQFAGRPLDVDDEVYESELATGDRNRALAYLTRHRGTLVGDVEDAIDTYVRLCSLLVDATDLATMAATLADGGRNPCSGEQVVPEWVAEAVLSVMASCGMYDFAGEWMLRVGLPAKSGVAGGLVAVSPAQFGIGVFSPPLDGRGNSVRGVAACDRLSDQFSLHLLHRPERATPVLAMHTPAGGVEGPSSVAPQDVEVGLGVLRLQGELEFTAAERVLRRLDPLIDDPEHIEATDWLVLDLELVTRANPVALALLRAIVDDLGESQVQVVVVDPQQRGLVPNAAAEVASLDAARERCATR